MRGFERLIALAIPAALIAGCASTLSGLGGSQTYACKAPEGVLCTSVAGVYANSLQNNLPGQRTDKRAPDPANILQTAPRTSPKLKPLADASALRSPARVLRVWLPAWEDSDGDLQDQSYLYLVVDSGRWLIEHTRAPSRREFTPIAAPGALPQAVSEPPAPAIPPTTNLPRAGVAAPSMPSLKDEADAERFTR